MLHRREWLAGVALGAIGAGLSRRLRADWNGPGGAPVIDGLCVLTDLDGEPGLDAETIAALRASGLTAINSTTPFPGDDAETTALKINKIKNIVEKNSDVLSLVLDDAGLAAAQQSGRVGVIIGFQSTEMFAAGLDCIDGFHRQGARIMQMSYNGPGLFGHGCLSESADGLTPLGHDALARMQALGILVDASHANRATTAQTIAGATRPLVISHTGCNAVYRHPRNNDDTELRALAERGGVAGIYLMPFLDGGSGELTADMFFAHLDHALRVCGTGHVGIGSDQGVRPVADGPEYRKNLREEVAARRAAGISAPGESPDRPPFIPAFNRPDRLPTIARHMSRRGYPERVIEAVLGGNFARVLAEAWGPAAAGR